MHQLTHQDYSEMETTKHILVALSQFSHIETSSASWIRRTEGKQRLLFPLG